MDDHGTDRNSIGRIPIVTTMSRLRRNSRAPCGRRRRYGPRSLLTASASTSCRSAPGRRLRASAAARRSRARRRPRRRAPGSARARPRRVRHGQLVAAGPADPSRIASHRPPAAREHQLGGVQRSDRRDRQRLANRRSRSSSGRPTVRSVVLRIATRSHIRSASSRRWVVRKIVTPRSRSAAIRSCTSREATGSSPEVGSSRNRTPGR